MISVNFIVKLPQSHGYDAIMCVVNSLTKRVHFILTHTTLNAKGTALIFLPVTQVAVLHIDADVVGHLGPPVVAGYELEGLEVACMSGDARIVVLFDDMVPQVSVIGDIDLTAEHE
jgi:hypothetical protein